MLQIHCGPINGGFSEPLGRVCIAAVGASYNVTIRKPACMYKNNREYFNILL
jgi:hypothetical protein